MCYIDTDNVTMPQAPTCEATDVHVNSHKYKKPDQQHGSSIGAIISSKSSRSPGHTELEQLRQEVRELKAAYQTEHDEKNNLLTRYVSPYTMYSVHSSDTVHVTIYNV